MNEPLKVLSCLVFTLAILTHGRSQEMFAREIHVATNGNDAHSGTAEAPLRSLQKAADAAKAGDVIRLHAGVYRGRVVLKAGGSDGNPLIIGAAEGAEVVLKGSSEISGWKQHAPGIWKIEQRKLNSQQLFADGQPLQQIGVQTRWHREKLWGDRVCLPPVGKDLNDLTEGSFFYDAPAQTLYCMLPDKSDPNQHLMEASDVDNVLDGSGASHVALRGLTFMHSNNTAGDKRQGMVRIGGKGWLIEDCRILYGDFAGLSVSGEGHVVRRCQINNNGDVGIDVNGSDAAHQYRWYPDRPPMGIVFEDLELVGNNYRRFYDQWHAGAMKLVPCVRGVTIRRCRIMNNHGAGVWFDGGLGDNRVEDNLIADNTTGIFYEIAAPAPGDKFGALIRNNRVVRSKNQGIYISASCNAIVENNTCFQNNWDIVVHGMPRKDVGGQRKLENNVVRNNIVNGKRVDVVVFIGKDSGSNTIDSNFYVNDDTGATPNTLAAGFSGTRGDYHAAVAHDLDQVRMNYGYERNGRAGDPTWMDVGTLDFRLRPGSPAAGKGWQSRAANGETSSSNE